mgnify:CR=1 FL=1
MKAMNEQTSAAVEEVRQTNCEFLTVQQVAKILKVNKNTVYDLISAKLLRAVKLGSTKVATIAVEDFIREMDARLIEYDTVTKKATWRKTTRVEKMPWWFLRFMRGDVRASSAPRPARSGGPALR